MNPVEIHRVTEADTAALRAFFEQLPEEDQTFFRDDVTSPGVIESWLGAGAGSCRVEVAAEDGAVIGYVGVMARIGWSSHVGDLRLVVDPNRRRSGLGRALARRGLLDGIDLELSKIVVEVVAEQEPAIALFRGLGFEVEALLKDHVRGRDEGLRDMLLLSHFVDDTWAAMQTTGLDEVVT